MIDYVLASSIVLAILLVPRLWARILLSRAKHRTLQGHPRLALLLARSVPAYAYGEEEFFGGDQAPAEVVRSRRSGFEHLASELRERAPRTLELSAELEGSLSDLAFVNAYRVPFQYRDYAKAHLRIGSVAARSDGPRVQDLDGNWTYDLGGAYGVNLFGTDFYKRCIDRGVERARELGLVLGAYHPIVAENVARLKAISGMDEVSFHMSGTEAVMQATRLARFHTGRSHAVRFAGAYHGWADGIQAGVGNPRPVKEIYTLREMDPRSLEALAARKDIACVLVNPIQAMSPNAAPASDSTLLASDRSAHYDKARYRAWLEDLREICTQKRMVLIFDEVFLGFRLALGGVQEYFGVRADMVTYGKTLGGGLPVGVVCGRRDLMRRFRDDRPADFCFARGTFNSHPYVMSTMNEFLRALDAPEIRKTFEGLEARWDTRARHLNQRLIDADCPVRVQNMVSVWTTLYTRPSRYNWMFQYYLRAEGLSLSWIGTGRFIFSHDLTDADFEHIVVRFTSAARRMRNDGWWWSDPALSNASIKRRVLMEMLRARLGRATSDRSTPPEAGEAEPCGTS
jgi:glutamate-1-semialdehyde 2,1-aminomutase